MTCVVATTNAIYPWSSVTQICHNGYPSYDDNRKVFEVNTST